jgi:hypothetical protein
LKQQKDLTIISDHDHRSSAFYFFDLFSVGSNIEEASMDDSVVVVLYFQTVERI